MKLNISLNELSDKLSSLSLLSNSLISNSLSQSIKSHSTQTRDNGDSYLENHIYPVTVHLIDYQLSLSNQVSPLLISGALLHDSLEDDKNLTDDQFIQNLGSELYNIVKPLSKPDYKNYQGSDRYQQKWNMSIDYVSLLHKSSMESKLIKLADRLNNVSNLSSVRDEKRQYYIKETEHFYLPLAKLNSLYYYDLIKTQIDNAKEKYKVYY